MLPQFGQVILKPLINREFGQIVVKDTSNKRPTFAQIITRQPPQS